MTDIEFVTSLVKSARSAQEIFASYSQEQIDRAVRAIGKKIYDNGYELAKIAVEETGMGDCASKTLKNKGKAKVVWYRMKAVKSRGILERDEKNGIVCVAKPIGVIGCISPTTNPTITPMHNAMCALKGGNALIVSPHPRSKKTSAITCELMREALKEVGCPEDLILVVEEPTIEISGLVMRLCDATIATGGPGMVKAAYSSGKPSFGVGSGNVQTLIDTDADLQEAAAMIAISRSYDRGILCTCEQCIHVHEAQFDDMVTALKKQGAYYISASEQVATLRDTLFKAGVLARDCVGTTPVDLGKKIGINIPEAAKFIVVQVQNFGTDEILTREKLSPVICIAAYHDFEDALSHAKTNLLNEGAGHSAVIHSHTTEHIELAGNVLPISRLGVNMIGSSGLGGSLDNGLMPTATLGCGSWGNNSLSENLWWNHLVNMTQIAYRDLDMKIPTDEEIWAE